MLLSPSVGSFLAEKASWALSGRLPIESADYCMLVNERRGNVTSQLAKAVSGVGFSFGVKAWTEMEIRCVKGMRRLKLISSENNSGFKGLINLT